MDEPSQKFKDLDYLVGRVGIPVVICGVLIYLLWHELGNFRQDIAWKLERSIRNERSIMQKLGIPVILDGDKKQ